MPKKRRVQDYRSTWLCREKKHGVEEDSTLQWNEVVFEIDLLKSQEINLDYILELIFDKHKKVKDKDVLIGDVCHLIRSSTGNRAKESLIVDFINSTDLNMLMKRQVL